MAEQHDLHEEPILIRAHGAQPASTDVRLKRRYEHYKFRYERYKRRYGRMTKIAVVFGLICIVLIPLTITSSIRQSQLASDKKDLVQKNDLLQIRIAELESKLFEAAPPGLRAIEYGRLIPLEDTYVKAIELSKPTWSDGGIGYQVLIQYPAAIDTAPKAVIELFDRSGSSVARDTLSLETSTDGEVPGSHSISGRFDRAHNHAAYFRASTN